MKIRNGFVSNSSSSSFIIGFKKSYTTGHSCPTCGSPTNIFKIIESFTEKGNETCVSARGIDEILKRHPYYIAAHSNELNKKIMAFLADKNAEEYEIMALEIDYCDDFLKDLILSNKNITVINNVD